MILIHTTSNREWVRSLFFPRGFIELKTCRQVLQGSRVEGPDVRIYQRFQKPSRPTTRSSLYTASNVNVLVTKMTNLVSRLFETKPDWEKTLATKMQNLGDRSEWIESDADLQTVVSAAAAADPLFTELLVLE